MTSNLTPGLWKHTTPSSSSAAACWESAAPQMNLKHIFSKITIATEQPSTGECWISAKKEYTSRPRAKEKPQQDGRRGEIAFRNKLHTCQKHSEGSNKTLCTPGDSTETEPDLPLSIWVSPVEVWVSSGLLQGQRLWVQQTWVGHRRSWRRLPLTQP